MNDNKKLIEEARSDFASSDDDGWGLVLRLADALEAAEKAHAPVCEMCRWEMGFGAREPIAHTCEKVHTPDERLVQEFYAEHYGPETGWIVERLELAVFVPTMGAEDSLRAVRRALDDAELDIQTFRLEAATPATRVEVPHAQGGWHQWVYLGGWRDYPTTVKRDSIGREHPHGWRDWLVLSCNNSECPARGIVRLDGVIASMEAAHPVPTEEGAG